jgi:hypothetical protein
MRSTEKLMVLLGSSFLVAAVVIYLLSASQFSGLVLVGALAVVTGGTYAVGSRVHWAPKRLDLLCVVLAVVSTALAIALLLASADVPVFARVSSVIGAVVSAHLAILRVRGAQQSLKGDPD